MKSLVLSLLLVFAVPAVADAAIFRGDTSQGREVVLKTTDAGQPYRLKVSFRAPCTDHKRLRAGTFFRSPFDRRTRMRVRDAGRYTFKLGDERIRARVSMRGHRLSPTKWRGRYEGHFVVRKNGNKVATCETPVVRWTATRGARPVRLLRFRADVSDG
jgi:hypothetical protein